MFLGIFFIYRLSVGEDAFSVKAPTACVEKTVKISGVFLELTSVIFLPHIIGAVLMMSAIGGNLAGDTSKFSALHRTVV